jgi:AcrR family transcriptional regulator
VPKLNSQVLEQNQNRIQQAALHIFTRQGYHGTSIREIAELAGVSLGNIYNYYKTKEDIYTSLVRRYSAQMAELQRQKVAPLLGNFDPANLAKTAGAVREMIAENSDYWRLMYIDVVEFGNKHFSHLYQGFPSALRRMNPSGFPNSPVAGDMAPEFVFSAIYLQFVTYFLIETLFGGRQHLGVSDEEAIAKLIRLATAGLTKTKSPGANSGETHARKANSAVAVRRGTGAGRRR